MYEIELEASGKILALDYGTKSIGIAISDSDCKMAFPRGACRNTKKGLLEIRQICEEEEVHTIVIGLPLTAEGETSVQTVQVKKFADHLEGTLHIPVVFHDERFTTEEAKKFMKKEYKKANLDAVSASLILEEYLKVR